jgi:EmrB/QacA subfamily drug resistance transporter
LFGMTNSVPHPRRWLILFIVLAAEIMDLLDSTIINVAAPTIRADLGGTTTTIQWLAAGYTLAFAVMLITGGRLGDILGRRRMFLVGAAGFTAASTLCALAPSVGVLIAARVAQGALGAIMIPQGLGVIRAVFPADELTAAFGAFGPVMGLSAVCGPILAGGLIGADLLGTGWRMVFLINLPLGLLALAGAARVMPESRASHAPRLDGGGMALVTVGALLLIYPLVEGRELGWPLWTFAMMAAAVPAFGLFALYERTRDGSPLIEPGLLRNRAFTGGLAVTVAFFSAMAGLMLVFSLCVQLGLHYSALHAGLALAPWALGTAIGAGLSGAVLGPRFGRRVLHAGLAVLVAGVAAIVMTLHLSGAAVSAWDFAPAMFAAGFGMGLAIAPMFDIVLAGVAEHEAGSASGVLNAVQQCGSAIGVAVVATVFFDLLNGGHSFVGAMERSAWLSAGLFAATFALAFLLPRRAREEAVAPAAGTRGDQVVAGAA